MLYLLYLNLWELYWGRPVRAYPIFIKIQRIYVYMLYLLYLNLWELYWGRPVGAWRGGVVHGRALRRTGLAAPANPCIPITSRPHFATHNPPNSALFLAVLAFVAQPLHPAQVSPQPPSFNPQHAPPCTYAPLPPDLGPRRARPRRLCAAPGLPRAAARLPARLRTAAGRLPAAQPHAAASLRRGHAAPQGHGMQPGA